MIFCFVLFCFAGIQFIRPELSGSPVTGNVQVPADVEKIFRSSCFNCHSGETKLEWFDKIAPASWMVVSHIKEGREALNFSHWDKLAPGERKASLFLALNMVLAGEMPLKSYTLVHPEAKISEADITVLKDYLISISPRNIADSNAIQAANKQFEDWSDRPVVKPAPNGINFFNDYKEWTPISTTDRFDNGTMRAILGNPAAIKAMRENKINPWPDGAAFAKVAWKQLIDSAGNVQPGEFLQVEFMIKDSKQYADTRGWGWARWKGMNLVPYGKNALFATECISCHQPMKDNDFVFTMPLQLKTGIK